MKPKHLLIPLVILGFVMGMILALVLIPANQEGSVSVRLLAVTNDAMGTRVALFQAQNTTDRMFFRVRSESERRDGGSNVIEVLQIANMDCLQPGAVLTFTLPCVDESEWRLNFHYLGQFNRREAIVHEIGWELWHKELIVYGRRGMTWLPQRREFKFSTGWVQPTTPGAVQ